MEAGVDRLFSWAIECRRNHGGSVLQRDVGCCETAASIAESAGQNASGLSVATVCSVAEQYGITEPVSAIFLHGLYRADRMSDSKEADEDASPVPDNSDGNQSPDPEVILCAVAGRTQTPALTAALLSQATHVGVGCSRAQDGQIAIVIVMIERRGHFVALDGSTEVGSAVLRTASRALMSGQRVAKLTAIADTGEGTHAEVVGAQIFAAPALESLTADVEAVPIDVPGDVPSSHCLSRVSVRVLPSSTLASALRLVTTIQPFELLRDDEGGATIAVKLGELYADPATCSSRYLVDVFVSGGTPSSSSAAEGKESDGGGAAGDCNQQSDEHADEEGGEPATAATPPAPVPGSVFATRFAITVTDHDDIGAAAQLESAALPSVVVPGSFSEVAVGIGQPGDLPSGFNPQVMPVTLTAASMARRLPLIACGAATAGVPNVSHVLLVAGMTEAEAHEQCPPGYEPVPLNIAQEIGIAMGALPLAEGHRTAAQRGGAAAADDGDADAGSDAASPAAAASSGDGGVEDDGSGVGVGVVLDVDPPHVYLCVLRDGSGEACQHMTLTAVAGLPGTHDLPPVAGPTGYSLQMVDVGIRTGVTSLTSASLDYGDEQAQSVKRPVRIILAQTVDAAAAGAAGFGSGLTIGRPDDGTSSSDPYSNPYELTDEEAAASAAEAEAEAERQAAMYEADRSELLEMVQAAVDQHTELKAAGDRLQRQLATHFFLKLSEEERDRVAASIAAGKGPGQQQPPAGASGAGVAFMAAERDRKYRDQLDAVAKERARMAEEQERHASRAMDLQSALDEKEARLGQVTRAFRDFKREIARGAAHSHTGKPIPRELIDRYEAAEAAKEEEVSRAQLKNIYAAAQVEKLEKAHAKREQLGDGLALIDFEQLKIENSTLVEKIEDRNEELSKLRKKTTAAVQVLTHVREKLHFVSAEVGRLSADLSTVDAEVSEQRGQLAAGKKAREQTRVDADKARQAQGFAYNDSLAIDYDVRKRTVSYVLCLVNGWPPLARRLLMRLSISNSARYFDSQVLKLKNDLHQLQSTYSAMLGATVAAQQSMRLHEMSMQ